VELLLRAGADVTARDRYGWTPLHVANAREVAECLLEAGASPNVAGDINGITPLNHVHTATDVGAKEAMLIAGADVTATDSVGWTPLHRAARVGRADVAELFMKWGANPNAGSVDGFTPLHAAACARSRDTVILLVKSGAEVNARGDDGKTPLHWTVMVGWRGGGELLLGMGADFRIPDAKGRAALFHARAIVGDYPEGPAIVAILEGAVARQDLAMAESQFRAAATCALVCAGLLGLGFAVIAVKMVRQKPKRRAEA
jgi:ankyrin repeat protein